MIDESDSQFDVAGRAGESGAGPLAGVRVVELAGLGPAPFAAMLLADMGADVVRVDRKADADNPRAVVDVLGRNRRSVALDLKDPQDVEALLALVSRADVFLEGYRPGVAERLGVGPADCLGRNPRLVYGRMTGWGQDGPYAHLGGHDINYIAVTGALDAIGRAGQPPSIPLALVGDFGGGGILLALGLVSALFEARTSGRGQVVDAAVVDGVALMMTYFTSRHSQGAFTLARGANIADSGSHFYEVYECGDGHYVSVGAVEPKFYANLLATLGIGDLPPEAQYDRHTWAASKQRLAEVFRTRTRAEWVAAFDGVDACFAPVLSMADAVADPHNQARGVHVDVAGLVQGSPAPRFARTPGGVHRPPPRPGQHDTEVFADWQIERNRS